MSLKGGVMKPTRKDSRAARVVCPTLSRFCGRAAGEDDGEAEGARRAARVRWATSRRLTRSGRSLDDCGRGAR